MAGQLNVTFPGINKTRGVDYTVAHGHQPGVAIVEIVPQATLPTLIGDLSWTDGDRTVTLNDCLIDKTSIRLTGAGFIQTVPIQDFRWKWQDAIAIGTWNVRRPDNTVDPATEKTPRELATMLYTLMGVPATDVTAIPVTTDRPYVDWDGGKAWAYADQLLALYGCSVAPIFADNSVKVVKMGVGATLPSGGDVVSPSIGASYTAYPDVLRQYAGDTIYQGKIKLHPVFVDTDNQIKRADAVSYKPPPGWSQATTEPEDLIPNGTPAQRGLANRTGFRWFQIDELVGGATTLTLPDGNTVPSIQHILPLRRKMLEVYTETGEMYEAEPRIEGTFCEKNPDNDALENRADWSEYTGDFEIDRELGIVKFRDPVFKKTEDGRFDFPDLYLTVGYHRQDAQKQYHQAYIEETIGSAGTPPAGRVANSLHLLIKGAYTNGTLTGYTTNATALEALLQQKIDEWKATFTAQTGSFNVYRHVQEISLSGQIRAVRWVVHCENAAFTYASQNADWIIGVRGWRRRLRDANSEPAQRERTNRRRRLHRPHRCRGGGGSVEAMTIRSGGEL